MSDEDGLVQDEERVFDPPLGTLIECSANCGSGYEIGAGEATCNFCDKLFCDGCHTENWGVRSCCEIEYCYDCIEEMHRYCFENRCSWTDNLESADDAVEMGGEPNPGVD